MAESINDMVEHKRHRPVWRTLVHILRFLGFWLATWIGPFSVCPFCGRPGCPGGAVSAGVFAAFCSVLVFLPRKLPAVFRRSFSHVRARFRGPRFDQKTG